MRRPRPAFCPRLETLEDRIALNVSSVFNARGQLQTYIVHQDGSLTLTNAQGTQTLDLRPGFTVRVAHAFLDAHRQVGLDVVYDDGEADEYDSTGTHPMGTNVLDLAHAIGRNGQFVIDVLYANNTPYSSGPDQDGTLMETTNAGTTQVATNVRWVSTYVDTRGNVGRAMGVFDSGGNLVANRTDSSGTYLLYDAPDGATEDMTDYSQTTSKKGGTVTDVTFGRFAGTYAVESGKAGTVTLGTGTDVRVGG